MKFNVIVQDFNNKEFVSYDIFPYLTQQYKVSRKRPKSYDEFKEFIESESMRQWWSRCEYEIILCGWPNTDTSKKIDVRWQIMKNIDIITELFMKHIKRWKRALENQ
jgi:hypothetical protein